MKKETSMADKLVAEREAIFAEEAFVVDVQILLNQIMKEKGFSRADLARAMNVSRARITQIFSDDCKNFTVRLLARAMHAMDEVPEVTCEFHMDQMRRKWEVQSRKLTNEAPNIVRMWNDETMENDTNWSANDNRMADLIRAA
jgi:transcriptional regulator with XRE-family HTH domain